MNKNSFPVKMVIKYSAILLFIILLFSYLSHKFSGKGGTLLDYEKEHQESQTAEQETQTADSPAQDTQTQTADSPVQDTQTQAADSPVQDTQEADVLLLLHYNGAPSPARVTYQDEFYYEPLSDELLTYITGKSFPADSDKLSGSDGISDLNVISDEDLVYLHVLHYDFAGNPAEGELICNKYIADDLSEIFYELYLAEYQIEKITLVDRYDGDDLASMTDNNTSCFNYREVDGTTSLSKHAYGLAIDINPLYNPYVRYDKNGGQIVSPAEGEYYADRSNTFPYKIDADDLCCRLFLEHGFTWGGNWNSCKDYQHFQKALP